jgi:hypothetical protein
MAKDRIIRRLTGREMIDADTEAAKAIVQLDLDREREKLDAQRDREAMIAKSHEMAGQIKGVRAMSKFGTVASLVWLKQVKETKAYKGIGTWETYCNYLGLDRRTIDEDIQNLKFFGEDFLATVANLSVGYKDLRKLRQIASNGDIIIDAGCVTIGEERIPLSPENSEDLQAAIENLLEAKNAAIEDQNAALRAKDKVLKAKEQLLNKQEKEIARYEARAAELGYTPGEEALMRKMDNARTSIDGFMMQFDPDIRPLPDDATPRMRAKLMHTLDYFRRVIIATFDTASELYGEPEIDDDWVPPHMRKPINSGQPAESGEQKNCRSCEFHKGMINPAKGIKIPGESGKCTREEGPCKSTTPADTEA